MSRIWVHFFEEISNSYNDIVDGDVNELDKESDKSHDGEADSGGNGNLLELLSVRLGTSLNQP